MVKLTFRKIPASVNRHWKKSRCSKSTVTTKFSNMTHALVFFSSWEKNLVADWTSEGFFSCWILSRMWIGDVTGKGHAAGGIQSANKSLSCGSPCWELTCSSRHHEKTLSKISWGEKWWGCCSKCMWAKKDKERGIPGAWSTALIFWAFSSCSEPFQLEHSRPWQRKDKKSRVSP